MEHVDYDLWASHVQGLLQDFAPETEKILELGCGTGSFALAMRQLADYTYVATDGSERMIKVARAKAEMEGADLQFETADFTDFRVDHPLDAVLLLYDGLNYLLDSKDLARMFDCVFRALRPGGVFVFDQSTPANSVNNEALMEDSGEAEGFSYVRHSSYDPTTRIHSTVFEIQVLGREFREEHRQRAYSLREILRASRKAGFECVAHLEDFGHDEASEESERIHWVLRKPAKA
ncbi:MAG: class I SAM-dependent methyltransferase [Rhodothermales bacterium]|nr:class I SAM-dependent methyltransferase [Rhodothermales bacterium]